MNGLIHSCLAITLISVLRIYNSFEINSRFEHRFPIHWKESCRLGSYQSFYNFWKILFSNIYHQNSQISLGMYGLNKVDVSDYWHYTNLKNSKTVWNFFILLPLILENIISIMVGNLDYILITWEVPDLHSEKTKWKRYCGLIHA